MHTITGTRFETLNRERLDPMVRLAHAIVYDRGTYLGIADRHPTGITLTDAGIIALPQAGTDPSSFGSDGSAWLLDLGGQAAG